MLQDYCIVAWQVTTGLAGTHNEAWSIFPSCLETTIMELVLKLPKNMCIYQYAKKIPKRYKNNGKLTGVVTKKVNGDGSLIMEALIFDRHHPHHLTLSATGGSRCF